MNSAQPPEAALEFLAGPLAGVILRVSRPVTTLGRHMGNDIVLMDPKVSRVHARLAWSDGEWAIANNSQTSTITVNGEPSERAILSDGDVVGIGEDTTFRFIATTDAAEVYRAAPTDVTLAPVVSAVDPAVEADATTEPAGAGVPPLAPASAPAAALASTVAVGVDGVGDPTGATQDVALRTELAPLPDLSLGVLEVTNHATGTTTTYPLVQERISIGRDPQNDISIDAPCVSERHLQLVRQGRQWLLIHPHPLGQPTANGLLFQGRQVQGREAFRRALAPGDRLRIGDAHGGLVTLTYREGREPAHRVPARMQQVPLGTSDMTIGRARENTLLLDHPQVSAHHARLMYEQGSYRLQDLGSTNHTYVNGLPITTRVLQSGDEVRIGPYKLIYEISLLLLYDESGGIRLDALDVRQAGEHGAVLLDDVSLCIPPRSFVALVGSSGAGKSTLLDALSGLRPARQGTVLYNGQDFYQNRAMFSTQIGYVPQDEIIHRDLTVERALYYAARLRLPRDFTPSQIEQRIEEVLDEVEMRHRRKLMIGHLSGGQRKRVSIALELLASPSLFFLDEPTSGLDPGLDRKMMVLLRKLADKGHTIVLVTHATSNINVCDYVCFLAPGGHVAYFGPPEEASTYFEQPGFAEIYGALEPTNERPDVPAEAGERFRRSPTYQRYVAEPLAHRPLIEAGGDERAAGHRGLGLTARLTLAWNQFTLLTTRYVELLWNDKRNLSILLLQSPVIALLLVIFILNLGDQKVFKMPASPATQADAQKFLFILAFSAVMFGCINAAREIVKEVHIYRRERTVNLGIAPYLSSKLVVLGGLCLLQCAVLLGIVGIAAPYYGGLIWPAGWEVYIALVLTAMCGLLLGLTISALVPNNDQAMSFIPIVLIPQVVFSGAIFPLQQIYIQVLSVVFAVRWAMASLGSTVHLNSAVLGGDKLFGSCSGCGTFRHDAHYLLFTWGVLVVMLVLLTALTAYLLKRKDAVRGR